MVDELKERQENVSAEVSEETPVYDTPDQEEQANESQEEATISQAQTPPEKPEEPEFVKHVNNWKVLREAKERAERERDEALAQLRKGAPQTQEEETTFADDDLIEGKHLKKTIGRTDARIRQLEGQLIEAQIRAKYPDFDEVVTTDSLSMLRDTDPELAESLAMNTNLYSQAVAAYKSIKRYGIVPNNYEKEKAVVNKNIAKPRTVTSLSPQQGESPLSRANAFANGLTDDLKKQIWQEMQDIVNNS